MLGPLFVTRSSKLTDGRVLPRESVLSAVFRMLRIIPKIRKRGVSWFLLRVGNELGEPKMRAGRVLNQLFWPALSAVSQSLSRNRARPFQRRAADILYLVYDLQICPITYDFVNALALAEMARRAQGLRAVHVVFVPGLNAGIRHEADDYENVVTHDARQNRILDLLIPMIQLLPTAIGYTFLEKRREVDVYLTGDLLFVPNTYRRGFPTAPNRKDVFDQARAEKPVFPMLRAPRRAGDEVADWLARHCDGKRPVVITLREYAYRPQRNSNVSAWIQFARYLEKNGYKPVFVRDSSVNETSAASQLEGFLIFWRASSDLCIRMALYEQAWCNLAVMHGPMELCWYNSHCCYLAFLLPGLAEQTSISTLEAQGFEIGNQLPFALSNQKIVWKLDIYEEIVKAFEGLERSRIPNEHEASN